MKGLKPCPFCGEPAGMADAYLDESGVGYLGCVNGLCQVKPRIPTGDPLADVLDLVAIWNARTPDDEAIEYIKRLKADVRKALET